MQILERLDFDGNIYSPEHRSGVGSGFNYDSQVAWEWEALSISTVILFWVPRELKTMPAFTTNVEFGFYVSSGKVVFGAPIDAPKTGYLTALANRHNLTINTDLYNTCYEAFHKAASPY